LAVGLAYATARVCITPKQGLLFPSAMQQGKPKARKEKEATGEAREAKAQAPFIN